MWRPVPSVGAGYTKAINGRLTETIGSDRKAPRAVELGEKLSSFVGRDHATFLLSVAVCWLCSLLFVVGTNGTFHNVGQHIEKPTSEASSIRLLYSTC